MTDEQASASTDTGVVSAAEHEPDKSALERFLDDRQTRKPSPHTMRAYRQDFMAIAPLLTGRRVGALGPADITRDSMRTAFAVYARDHEAASIR